MDPFVRLAAIAAPLDQPDINTDMLIPVHFLRKPRAAGYGGFLLHHQRFNPDGTVKSDFILNRPPYAEARILVTGANFGCGSSREGAVYALLDFGIRAVIASSFGPFQAANSYQNGLLPVVLREEDVARLRGKLHAKPGACLTVDLPSQTVLDPDGCRYRFDIEPSRKEQLLNGLDDIDITSRFAAETEEFERNRELALPWLKGEALRILVTRDTDRNA
ncbi:MAG: 3-isopropylmalate dehydratase small subunit [Burkholderiales bacterium]|nr:3-isopropylmalate dehydratase small subunit [Burkholderiales bacterium]